MQRVGHFEFGLDVRLINPGNQQAVDDIEALWQQGEHIRGWARYWSLVYGWLTNWLDDHPELATAVKLVCYEDLCQRPAQQLEELLRFAQLHDPKLIDHWQSQISAPSYYDSGFSDDERSVIEEETAGVVLELARWNRAK